MSVNLHHFSTTQLDHIRGGLRTAVVCIEQEEVQEIVIDLIPLARKYGFARVDTKKWMVYAELKGTHLKVGWMRQRS